MPTYEYVCTSCQTPLEVVQSIHEPSLTDCPACGDGRLRKVFGNVGVVFKGSGFYRTDSRSKSAASAATPSKESREPKDSKDSKDAKKSSDPGGTGSTGAAAAGATSGNGQGSTGSASRTKGSEKAAAAATS